MTEPDIPEMLLKSDAELTPELLQQFEVMFRAEFAAYRANLPVEAARIASELTVKMHRDFPDLPEDVRLVVTFDD